MLTYLHMDHVGGLLVDGVKARLRSDLRIHVAVSQTKFRESPDFSHNSMPSPVPDVLRAVTKRFLEEHKSQLRSFERNIRWRRERSLFGLAETRPGTA